MNRPNPESKPRHPVALLLLLLVYLLAGICLVLAFWIVFFGSFLLYVGVEHLWWLLTHRPF